jgi:hypothetical protein
MWITDVKKGPERPFNGGGGEKVTTNIALKLNLFSYKSIVFFVIHSQNLHS